ncbi:hypothetical protein ONS95_003573 [Cadophora gregata]|uniref:uncharacterized protein n=1 Tax=Cadophora gregata TaxID=51156 RepID=UPI0026DD29F4|nr:uncharacterized protein ONS95_003573 [Cadophora gregata]KAK0106851.1 hypothetical protein ONS95_003573 [Cadophora gregata]
MNSSHHANRSGRGQTSSPGRGRARGGRSRGGFNERPTFSSGPSSVPTIQQVIPGSAVSIVLKVDQPTGRQVQGTVAELLTRGNHPRGIKVRLQDGRVGRVQRMASEEEARVGAEGLSGLGRNGEGRSGANGHGGGVGMETGMRSEMQMMGEQVGGFTGRKYGDYRLDAPDEPPASELSLEDYIVTKGNKKNRRGKNISKTDPNLETAVGSGQAEVVGDGSAAPSATTVCPVCGEFEGDEVAVAHHVNGHFD